MKGKLKRIDKYPNCLACQGESVYYCRVPGKFDPTKTLRVDEYLDYTKCTRCFSLQQYPIPSEKKLSQFVIREYSHGKKRLEFEVAVSNSAKLQHLAIVKTIMEYGITDKVLDVGSGIGNLCAYLQEHKIAYQGIDISPEVVVVAKKRGLRVEQKDLGDIKSYGYFSAISMSHVFEHLSDPEVKLREIHKLLGRNGLFISVQPTVSMTNILRKVLRLNSRDSESSSSLAYLNLNPWHIVIYSLQGMKLLAEREGFIVVDIIPMHSLKSKGRMGMIRTVYNGINIVGEHVFPQQWPFHVAHLFILKKI